MASVDEVNSAYDVIVVGTGAGAFAAAVTAAIAGLDVLMLERAGEIGGTSAQSGGAIWIPLSRQAVAGGYTDSAEDVRAYLRRLMGNHYDAAMIDAFLARAPEALAFFEDNTDIRYAVRPLSPDYYPEFPGATIAGRALEVNEYDGRKLGAWFGKLRAPPPGMMLFGGMMLNRQDIGNFLAMTRAPKAALYCARRMARFFLDRLSHKRGTRLVIGNALIAMLLRKALDRGVRIELNADLRRLITNEQGAVTGVAATLANGETVDIAARRGVVLGTGGISRNPRVLVDRPGTRADHVSMAAPHADGAVAAMAEALGARSGAGLADNFYWAPMSQIRHADGRVETFPHIVTDRAKPGIIAITDKGARFTNEGDSYHRFVQAMIARQRAGAERFYLIADSRAIRAYGLGLARPDPGGRGALIRNGYLIEARSVEALARRLNIDPVALAETIARHNRDAENGFDTEFQKGESAYNKAQGDMTRKNPGMAPIAKPPFYAVRIFTGDLGSAKGLVTDGSARVLREDGAPIPGLFAVGNAMNSITAGTYPGAGATLGPGLTFGYVAGRVLAGER